jgi:hypothetical protein
MYIVLLALLYILMMMVVTSGSVMQGVVTLLIGASLVALAVYLLDTPRRLHARRMADQADQGDAGPDQ